MISFRLAQPADQHFVSVRDRLDQTRLDVNDRRQIVLAQTVFQFNRRFDFKLFQAVKRRRLARTVANVVKLRLRVKDPEARFQRQRFAQAVSPAAFRADAPQRPVAVGIDDTVVGFEVRFLETAVNRRKRVPVVLLKAIV